MSNYIAFCRHPKTGKWQWAVMLDDYYGSHRYGVKFADGKVFKDEKVETRNPDKLPPEDIWKKFFK